MKEGWATKYVGIPYESQGQTNSGANCYGLVVLVYKEELSVDLPWFIDIDPERTEDRAEYQKVWKEWRVSEWIPVSPGAERAGDVVDMKVLGLPHCGVVVGGGKMLHSRPQCGTSIESYQRGLFCRRVKNLYRHSSMQ